MKKGLIYTLTCYLIWGFFPIYYKLLKTIPPYEMLANRIFWSFIFMIFLILFLKQKEVLIYDIRKVLQNKKVLFLISCASILITINWLVYIIAVNSNNILHASFGYYLNPIITILLAVIFLKERLTRTQIVACFFVFLSLMYLFITLGTLPWISLFLALTFGFYSLCKKKIDLGAESSLFIETLITLPATCIYLIYLYKTNTLIGIYENTFTIILLILSGVITAVPLLLFAKGAKTTPLYLLGILQYIPPTIQFLIGTFVYKEKLDINRLISFSIIWIAVIIFCISTVLTLNKNKIKKQY